MRTFFNPDGEVITPGLSFTGEINGESVLVKPDAWTFGLTFLESRGVTYTDDFPNITGETPTSEVVAAIKESDKSTALLELTSIEEEGFEFSGVYVSYTSQDLELIARQKQFFALENDPNASDILRFVNGSELAVTPSTVDSLLLTSFSQSRQARQHYENTLLAIEGSNTPENYRFQGDTASTPETLETQLRGSLRFTLTAEGAPEGDEYFELRLGGQTILSQSGLPSTSEVSDAIVGQYNSLTVDYFCGGSGHNAEFYVLDIENI